MITLYGTAWCGDCVRARLFLKAVGVAYAYVDINHDADAAARVMKINNGMRSVPTIVFENGVVLVEPDNKSLKASLESQRLI